MNKNIGIKILYMVLVLIMICNTIGCSASTDTSKNDTGNKNTDSTDNNSEYTGRLLNLPEGVTYIEDICKLEDGSIRLAGVNDDASDGNIWLSDDSGESWEKTFAYGQNLPEEVKSVVKADQIMPMLVDNGDVIWMIFDEDGTSSNYLEKTDGSCKILDITLPELSSAYKFIGNNMMSSCQYVKDSLYLISDLQNKVYLYNLDTSELVTTYLDDDETITGYYFNSDTLFVSLESGAKAFDINTGKENDNTNIKALHDKISNQSSEDLYIGMLSTGLYVKDNVIYFADSTGIYECKDNQINPIISDLKISNTATISKLLGLSEDTFLVFTMDMETSDDISIMIYKKNDSSESVVDKTITVYSLYENDTLSQIINNFETKYSDIAINYEVGITGNDAVQYKDAINTLGMKVMSEEGPDIIIMDNISIDNYQQKGVLENITDVYEEMSKEESLLKNITEAYKFDDGIYAIPMQFGIETILANKSIIDDNNDVDTLIEQIGNLNNEGNSIAPYSTMSYENIVKMISYNYATKVMAEDFIDEVALQKICEQLQMLYEIGDLSADEPWGLEDLDLEAGMLGAFDVALDRAQMSIDYIDTADGIQQIVQTAAKSPDRVWNLLNQYGNNYYLPQNILSINANSKQKDEAKQFVKYALSSECQSKFNGLSVNETALRQKLMNTVALEVSLGEDINTSAKYDPLQAEQIDPILEVINKLDTPILNDNTIKEIVLEKMQDCVKGTITPTQLIENFNQKVKLYMSE